MSESEEEILVSVDGPDDPTEESHEDEVEEHETVPTSFGESLVGRNQVVLRSGGVWRTRIVTDAKETPSYMRTCLLTPVSYIWVSLLATEQLVLTRYKPLCNLPRSESISRNSVSYKDFPLAHFGFCGSVPYSSLLILFNFFLHSMPITNIIYTHMLFQLFHSMVFFRCEAYRDFFRPSFS